MARKPNKPARPRKDDAKPKSRKPQTEAPAQSVSGEPTRGRPTTYTPEIAEEILTRLADGETLPTICRDDHMPARTTVIGWVIDDRDGFSDRYHRARDLQRDAWADDMVEISDDGRNDWIEKTKANGDTTVTFSRDHVERSKLRVSTRQWLMKVGSPQKYGDKVEQTHKGDAAFLAVWQAMGGGASKKPEA